MDNDFGAGCGTGATMTTTKGFRRLVYLNLIGWMRTGFYIFGSYMDMKSSGSCHR